MPANRQVSDTRERDPWRLSASVAVAIATIVAIAGGVSLLLHRSAGQPASEVILYCAQDQVFAEPILAEFTRRTGIRVKAVFDSEAVKTVGLANRLLAERGHPACDVFWGNEEFRTRQLAAAGIFREPDGWTAFGRRTRRLVVDTRRIGDPSSVDLEPAGQGGTIVIDPPAKGPPITPPASLLELKNSRWRGKVSLAFPLFGTTATHLHALRQHWGESNWTTWCRALAANRPFLEEGNSQVVRRVARGEAWIGLTDSDDIGAGRREGFSVAALPVSPEMLTIPNTVGIVRGAPHPEAAQRLSDHLTSPEVRAELVAVAALEDGAADEATLQPDWPVLLRELDRSTARLQEIFRR